MSGPDFGRLHSLSCRNSVAHVHVATYDFLMACFRFHCTALLAQAFREPLPAGQPAEGAERLPLLGERGLVNRANYCFMNVVRIQRAATAQHHQPAVLPIQSNTRNSSTLLQPALRLGRQSLCSFGS